MLGILARCRISLYWMGSCQLMFRMRFRHLSVRSGMQVDTISRRVKGIGKQHGEEDSEKVWCQHTALFDTTVDEKGFRGGSIEQDCTFHVGMKIEWLKQDRLPTLDGFRWDVITTWCFVVWEGVDCSSKMGTSSSFSILGRFLVPLRAALEIGVSQEYNSVFSTHLDNCSSQLIYSPRFNWGSPLHSWAKGLLGAVVHATNVTRLYTALYSIAQLLPVIIGALSGNVLSGATSFSECCESIFVGAFLLRRLHVWP